jgi:uncharacterized protein
MNPEFEARRAAATMSSTSSRIDCAPRALSVEVRRKANVVLCLLLMLCPLFATAKDTLRTIDWLELMPEAERIALEKLSSSISHEGDGPAYDFNSVATVAELDGASGRIAAFVVPIAHDDKGRITELFLVPYFGACVHMPPPPPNQIIYVRPETPIASADFWDPIWAIGTLRIAQTSNEMADLKEIDLAEFQGTQE